MTKIMLVEDDKSLREIYGVRLLAEGYDIVSAGDGEEALAMAIKERPQLIVSDVMMPKISGFDMLDILRSTTETRNIKVIMMTALSSEEQRARGESLGADRYLVKSQVGIEDVVRVVHEVLGDQAGALSPNGQPSGPVNVAPSMPAAAAPMPIQPAMQPAVRPVEPLSVAPRPVSAPPQTTPPQPLVPVPQPAPTTMPRPGVTPPVSTSSVPKPSSLKTRIIQPLNDPNVAQVDINDLLNKELAKEEGTSPAPISAEQEKAVISQQLADFTPPVTMDDQTTQTDDTPEITINPDGTIKSDVTLPQLPATPPPQPMAPVTPATPQQATPPPARSSPTAPPQAPPAPQMPPSVPPVA